VLGRRGRIQDVDPGFCLPIHWNCKEVNGTCSLTLSLRKWDSAKISSVIRWMFFSVQRLMYSASTSFGCTTVCQDVYVLLCGRVRIRSSVPMGCWDCRGE